MLYLGLQIPSKKAFKKSKNQPKTTETPKVFGVPGYCLNSFYWCLVVWWCGLFFGWLAFVFYGKQVWDEEDIPKVCSRCFYVFSLYLEPKRASNKELSALGSRNPKLNP